jgi:ADP-heptose:LPS heptosyltransferase
MDLRRSLALQTLATLAEVEGVRFYSLQKGPPAAELAELAPRWPGPPVIDLTEDLGDFADTAALVANLDLVITCDTSTAHLAGALGKPVWILNRFDTCWRWLTDRDDSPWYPSARLFTQARPGDWAGVVDDLKPALAAFAEAPSRRST